MTRDWEQQLRIWGRAPGPAEAAKMEATDAQIKLALAASTALAAHKTYTATQGSYKNLTHIPSESDVDIRVVCRDIQFSDMTSIDPAATTGTAARAALLKQFDLSGEASYSFNTFRDDVGAALVARFGPPPAVTPGDKAFGVRETRYRVDSDVVAAIPHIRYYANGTSVEGVGFLTRKGRLIVNWPEQQYRNGVTKNQATSERFKAMVRALKSLRDEMKDQGKPAAHDIASFLIECLVWNVPDSKFAHTAFYDDMKEVLRAIYTGTKGDAPPCWEWTEENGLKWLFKNNPGWTAAQVNAFVLAAWNHVGFSD